ncbi:hypothetical protein ACIBJC_38410 [Streptomyces sp. NPDC050509]|uniref:hypothetical protein n=1 Tax=Streptomyces sp. NPDC050509 TaxID=3365620 RepID=UPI00378A1524
MAERLAELAELAELAQLAQLDDEYDVLEYGDSTAGQVDAEATAEARRLENPPRGSSRTHGHTQHKSDPRVPLNRLRFP